MKTKLILVVIFFSTQVFSQVNTNNLGFGVSPFGNSWLKYKFSSNSNNYTSSFENVKGKEYMRLDYNNYLNAHLFFEMKLTQGTSIMIEGNYADMKLEKATLGVNNSLEIEKFKDKVNIYALNLYYGYTLNNKKRLQIPLYFGFGGNYVSGEPIDKFFFSISGKTRIKFYVSNKIAIYSGVSYDTGLSSSKSGTTGVKENDLSIGFNAFHIDSGIMFSL